jgi:hypothetical protein
MCMSHARGKKGVKSDQRLRSCFSTESSHRGGVARNQEIASTKTQTKSTKSTKNTKSTKSKTELVVSLNAGKGKDKQNIRIICTEQVLKTQTM